MTPRLAFKAPHRRSRSVARIVGTGTGCSRMAAAKRVVTESDGGGRVFKSLGDGLLVEFTSPVEATRTALLVQETIARTAPSREVKLELRVAIHMGEVTVEGTD